MKKMKVLWFMIVFLALGLVLAGCLNKEETQSLNPDDDVFLMGSTSILISEVYYDTTGDDNVQEYVELYNMSTAKVNIGGWKLTDNAGTYTIPSGTYIAPKSAITIARNAAGFKALFGKNPVISGLTLSFGNTGDKLTLTNSSGSTIDFVAWESYVSGWTCYANTSYSIARSQVTSDNDTSSNWSSNVTPTPGTVPGAYFRVHFIDVGQGDCILLQAPTGETMLIDAGSYESAVENKVLSYLKSVGVTKINATVATHPHSDHIGSLDAVIRNLDVTRAYDSGLSYTSVSYSDYINAINSKGVPMYTARRGNTYNLSSSVKVTFLSPTSTLVTNPADTNDVSIVLRVTYGSTSFILTGDAPQFVETQIMSAGYTVNSEVLKVGHHGSRTSTAPAFVDAVTPTRGAVILVGEGNSYGHPHTETLTTLNARGVPIYRQDVDGGMNSDFVFYSTGSSVGKQ